FFLPLGIVEWISEFYDAEAMTVEVHGYNDYDDGDPFPGLVYQVEGEPISELRVVSPDAPGGRFVFEFGDRAVSLRDEGDTQLMAWSASGNVEDWIGPGSGPGIALVSSQDDPIDD